MRTSNKLASLRTRGVWASATAAALCVSPFAAAQGPVLNSPPVNIPAMPATYSQSILAPAAAGQNLADAVEAARTRLNEGTMPQPSVAADRLRGSIANLEAFFAQAGTVRQADWLRFLRVDQIRQELDSQSPSVQNLIQIEKNTRQNYPGLELPPVAQFRRDLIAYTNAVRFGADPAATVRGLDQRLQSLATEIRESDNDASLDRQRDLGLIVNYLTASQQTPELVSAIRGRYSYPAGQVWVSAPFMQQYLSRPVNNASPVNELILGTTLRGNACLVGQVTPVLVPNPSAATIRLTLNGRITSQNIGYNRGVRLRTSSTANVVACETVQLSDYGLVQFNDTGVNSTFASRINSIEHNLKIVRKIATNRAAEQKPQADAIGQQRLERRLATQYHQQLGEQLAEGNVRLQPQSMPILTRLGLSRPQRSSWTTSNFLSLAWTAGEPDQLAAPGPCPLPVPGYGATAQLHQSLAINYLDTVLAGRVIRSEDLDEFARQFGAVPGGRLQNESEGEPWSITMAGYHPVEVEFNNNLISFQIRTTQLDRGDQTLPQPATIRADYAIELIDGAIQLRRQGDVDIQFAGRAGRGLRAVTLRSFLKDKFDQVFAPTLFDYPRRPTDRLPPGAPPIRIVSMATAGGWLQATLN